MKLRHMAPIVALLLTSGCATLVQGTRQNISVSSMPPGAAVYANGEARGETPRVVTLARRGGQHVRVQASGFEPYEVRFARRPSVMGWMLALLGNGWNGVLPGLLIDWLTGSVYELTPDQIHAAVAIAPAGTARATPTPTPTQTAVPDVTLRPGPAPASQAPQRIEAPGGGEMVVAENPAIRPTPWVADRYGREFYWWQCPAARQLLRQYEIAFATYEEAHASGRRVSTEPGCQGPRR